ncbi:p-loop domain-containing protein [Desulfonema limicola]|uniref:P-loop domain-containing protein n=1 Tax=Desulfonema limicola TaxID=45656 RepID=A0A975BCP7_9BACT|nr:AVAST type 4 anti-phage nuclease Avs4 [Desulfonema limicola]QTA82765.1 p-loop domain-containing protein [Desulfonema limicola]
MIKPNWDIFKVKFSENPQSNFEWFCYLLFCKEFNKPYGIFRYKNQSAIETNPVKTGNDEIGWQAKFYDTPLSSHKTDLLNTIKKAKRDYPNLTKLVIYTNSEWGQYKGKDPKGLIEIEGKAKTLNIILDWRVASFFESEFVSVKNDIIAKHFFTLEKSIFDLSEEQKKHTQNILYEIRTSISFNNISFEIDRNSQLEKLKDKSQQISILSGIGGVGKTVLVKKLYEQLKDEIPFFVFKAVEFELRNINDLFTDFTFYDFARAYKDIKNKIIVIDSSEKLLDLKNSDPFKEFLKILIEDKWEIIFTTRENYLEDLNYQFFEIYNIAPQNIRINNLELKELFTISDQYLFSLPKDEKLVELIRNPFYLNEYLKFYTDREELKYSEFKNKLWNRNIKKAKPERERCFLQIAFERASTGQFFISPDCESNILDNELVEDGIVGYEATGYFITHDIYEEWALEKIIEKEFIKKTENEDFFDKIGESLPVRRCFRNWLSEKLLLEDSDIKEFIETAIENKQVKPFWKDEIFVSVLLSDYSEIFFDIFKVQLLDNNQKLLKKLTFILRIACKEVDDNFFKQLGFKTLNIFTLKYVLTKPKGRGWESLIKFVYENIKAIGIKNINFIFPVIYDWNSKVNQGETTKLSSLIALQYYQWIINDNSHFSRDDAKNNLLETIIYGSSEIKDELKYVFEAILKHGWKNHRDPYYDLSKFILTKLEGTPVSRILPEYVLKLADLFWTYQPKSEHSYYSPGREIEQYFGLDTNQFDCFPSSAFQTPIYYLLQSSLQKTIDFILNFTNRSVRNYVVSGFDNPVQEIEVFFENGDVKKQYISHCLWNLYRGTSSPVSPYLLQSIHMALEKYFLEQGKNADSKVLESWLLYLLKNSESASISSVVTSIVLAYPEKTFNIAKILFRTKEFINHDTSRLISDKQAESLYSIGYGLNYKKDIHADERIKTCEDEHRKWTLEHQFLKYQLSKNMDTSDKEFSSRQNDLWEILDNYYQELPSESEQSEWDKTWRLYLARMDRRKMDITAEKTEQGLAIQFNPEIAPELEKYREKTIAKSTESWKYSSLKIWSEYKFIRDEKYKQYEQYEDNPNLALNEVKEILSKLNKISAPERYKFQLSEDEYFFTFNQSIPAYVCSVLVRDHFNELSKEEKELCKDIIIEVALSSLDPNYQYQIFDGVQPSISLLPALLNNFPEENEKIKIILLLTLFNEYPVVGMFANESFNIYPITAIHALWKDNFDDAQSLLFGYLLLKPRYDAFRKSIREQYNKVQSMEKFCDDNNEALQDVIENNLTLSSLKEIDKLSLHTLNTAFKIIPFKTDNEDHKIIVKIIISAFVLKILSDDRYGKIDYKIKHDFLKTYAYFVLNLPKNEIQDYLNPFLDNFNLSESIADLFQEIILAEDILNTYDNFWTVWELFKEKVIELCKKGDDYWNVKEIVKSYLFAGFPWKETAKDWHSLKDKNKRFFKEISEKIGHCPSAIYSISKLLNDIGTPYMDDGVIWISYILDKNQDYIDKKLEENTIYYMENFIRKYIYKNREKIKRTRSSKDKVLIILNFLIDKGSAVGYMLRESIV